MTSGVYDRHLPPLNITQRDDLIYVAAMYETKGRIYVRGRKRLVMNLNNKRQAKYLSELLNAKITILRMKDYTKSVYYSITLSGKKMQALLVLIAPFYKGDGVKV